MSRDEAHVGGPPRRAEVCAERGGESASQTPPTNGACSARPTCPACGGPLMEIRAKLQCRQCGQICETCCEGGRQ